MKTCGNKLVPSFKLWLSSKDAEGVFGDGKWRLLAAIESEGSLQAACKKLGISYRKAWGDLRKVEKYLGVKFLERQRGGSGGGQTKLTETGQKWLLQYSQFHSEIEDAVTRAYKKYIPNLPWNDNQRGDNRKSENKK